MHYLGFVFVAEPTEKAVAEAMGAHKGSEWDWYRCGGRYDGYLQGADEMERRSTENGFNFSSENEKAAKNFCKVCDLPEGMKPYFFVSDYDFVPREYYNKFEKSSYHTEFFGAILDTPYWQERWEAALKKYADKYIVVVDAHN